MGVRGEKGGVRRRVRVWGGESEGGDRRKGE